MIINTYAEKSTKKSGKKSTTKYSLNNNLLQNLNGPISYNTLGESEGADEHLQYLKEIYKSHLHFNSAEPKKFQAKAFTKNGEIYIAPGEESSLPHELAHVYQQKTQNIPATGKINGEKVNTDSKLEKDADKISKNIGGYIPRVIISGKRQDVTNDIMQFALPSKETYKFIKQISQEMGIPDSIMTDEKVKDIFRKYEENIYTYLYYREERNDYKSLLIKEIKNDPECQLYLNLNSNRSQWTNFNEGGNQRISDIVDMLITEKIFKDYDGAYTLHQAMSLLSDSQKESVSKDILRLKDCCDDDGIKSVLQGANINVTPATKMLNFEEKDINTKERLAASFVKRLNLMTKYVDSVYKNFGEKYWIRSTGSDLHQDGQHALFLINKETKEIEKVYKPHDMEADAMVSGKKGMFAESNVLIKEDFIERCRKLGLNLGENTNALATMDIGTLDHTEEFIKKKGEMTPNEAKVYFFRAGILKVITDAMAVIDLHADNIMPTEKGPMIIDAEIDFFHYGKNSMLWGETGALNVDEINGNPTNSTFIIRGGKDEREIRSGKAFKDKDSEYHKMYGEGYDFMLQQMKDKKKLGKFKKKFKKHLKNVNKVRILPIKTHFLAITLKNFITEESTKEETVKIIIQDIKEGIAKENSKFLSSKYVKVELNDDKLRSALMKTFENRTIPAMYAEMDGILYLDDIEVGRILKKDDTKESVIDKDELINIIRRCFKETIDLLK